VSTGKNRVSRIFLLIGLILFVLYGVFFVWYAIGYSSSHGHACITYCDNCSGIVLSIKTSSELAHSKTLRLARKADTLDLGLPFCDKNDGLWGFVEVGDRIEQQGDNLEVIITRPGGAESQRFKLGCCEF